METGDSAQEHTFSQLVFSDLQRIRPGTRAGWAAVIVRIGQVPGVLASVLLRATQVSFRSGHVRTARLFQLLGNTLVGADFCPGVVVGTGCVLVHPTGVVLGSGARVGDNVTFASGVVLAARYYEGDREQSYPVVGDGVTLGAHAVLRGGVRIGRNGMVGANSVVLDDVPPDTVVLGIPARQISRRGESRPSPDKGQA